MKKNLLALIASLALAGIAQAGAGCCPATAAAKEGDAEAKVVASVKAEGSCGTALSAKDCSVEACLAAGKDPSTCEGFAVSKVLGENTLASLKLDETQLAKLDKAYTGKSLQCEVSRAECAKELAGVLTEEQIKTVDATLAKVGAGYKASMAQ
jgi:hypothetical protein